MGYFRCTNSDGQLVQPQSLLKTSITGTVRRYMTLATDQGYTFHRFYLGITAMRLQPQVTGFGYVANFYGDSMVQQQIASLGYSLWITPDRVVQKTTTQYKDTLTLSLRNFRIPQYGETPVHAKVMLTLQDGTVIESAVSSYNMRQVVEAVAERFDSYDTVAKQSVKTMCEKYATMNDWNISKILSWNE